MSSLSLYGVPLGAGAGRGGILMPKVKHKFRVRVFNFGPIGGGIELTQQVKSVDRPKIQHQEVTVHSYNSIAYFAGKAEFQTVNLVVRDDVTNSVSALVGHQEQKQMNHFEQTSPLAGSNYKFSMFIETLDGGNDAVLEQWHLEGCFLSNIEYDSFDYDTSDVMTISMTIRYDNATQSGGLMPVLPQRLIGPML